MANILLIEPDPNLSKIYNEALGLDGHKIFVRRSAQRAIHLLDDQAVDLILLEPKLVGHNGIEFLYELRSYVEWQSIPVILLTSQDAAIMQNKILTEKIGIVAYLYKPVTTTNLLRLSVKQALNIKTV